MGGMVLEPGMKVRSKKTGKVGVVAQNPFGGLLESPSRIMVDYEGLFQEEEPDEKNLEILGAIEIEVSGEKCRNCLFFNGRECFRYRKGRAGMIFEGRNGKRIPTKIPPDCQLP